MDRKVNVLLVDDSRTVLMKLEAILGEAEGVAIVGTAQSGAAAIRVAQESKPDLVLLDIVMPGLDGLSALRTIRSMSPAVQIVMVSSMGGSTAKAEEAFKLGARQVIAKPFDPEAILSVIEDVRAELDPDAREVAEA